MKIKLASLLIAAFSLSGSAHASVTDDVRGLVEQNRFSEAFELGKKNPDLLGDPVFDFFYGIAAMESGRVGDGVLSLERYVLSYPDNRNARFNLARGYYMLGEDQRAKDEFEGLLNTDISSEQRINVERYLDAIRAREARYQPTANLWVEAGLGYDNNINSGLSTATLSIPGLGPLILANDSTVAREADWFASYAAGAQGTLPIAPGLALFGGASFDGRQYAQHNNDQFEQFNYGASGGMSHLSGKNLYRLGLGVQQQIADQQNYRRTATLSGEWVHQFDQFTRVGASAFVGAIDFDNISTHTFKSKTDPMTPSGSDLKSANYWGASANWMRTFGISWQPVLSLSGTVLREESTQNRPDFSRDVYSVRAQLSLTPAPRWSSALGLTYQQAKHQGAFGMLSSEARRDELFALDGMVSYRIDKRWSVRAEAQWNNQSSNIGLFDYSRFAVATKLRYELN